SRARRDLHSFPTRRSSDLALHYYPTFITDYDEGWTRSALPAPGIDPALPPDSPPSEVYAIYPAAHIPAFHYPNPVTGDRTHYPAAQLPSAALLAEREFHPQTRAVVPATDIAAALTEAERLLRQVKDHHEIENLENAYG